MGQRVAIVVTTLFCLTAAFEAHAELRHIERDGRTDYDIYLPEGYSADRQWPLLVAFHWSTGRAHSMFKLWKEAADRFGIVLALPNARSRMRWTKRDADDVLDMLVSVTTQLPIDPARIHATGFSAGANFAYRLLATQPGLFRSVGPFAGRLSARPGELDRHQEPSHTRICIFHGTRDRTIRFKNAERAAQKLTRAGFEVKTSTYNQGHWVSSDYAEAMWGCLNVQDAAHES